MCPLGEINRLICTCCTYSSSTRNLHLISTANLHFQKTLILFQKFRFSFYFGGSLLQFVSKTWKRDEQQKLDGTTHSKDNNNDIDEMPRCQEVGAIKEE